MKTREHVRRLKSVLEKRRIALRQSLINDIAGLKAGVYKDLQQLKYLNQNKTVVEPDAENRKILAWYGRWKEIISFEPRRQGDTK